MKKLFAVLTILVVALVMVACTQEEYKIAMITDIGDVDDGTFNQGTWEGILRYAEEFEVSKQYYRPATTTSAEYVKQIDIAVAGGAEIVITPGFLFAEPIAEAQEKYPDVHFVILDAAPETIADNTVSYVFAETESAFLAGYAVVKDGFTELGFMGGQPFPSVVTFGIGFIAGAYQAASELELETFSFNPDYYAYQFTFEPSSAVQSAADGWYDDGVEVIHVAAGGAGKSVMNAAELKTNKWVVGVDSDEEGKSPKVISSALKNVGEAAYQALEAHFDGEWDEIGGTQVRLTAANGGVGLPMTTSRFTTFNQTAYNALLAKVVDQTYDVPSDVAELYAFVDDLGYTLDPEFEDIIIQDPQF